MFPHNKFQCHYELDQRPDSDLVTLNQTAYRFIEAALGKNYPLRIEDDGLPNPVEYYLLYVAALIHGAADAVLTLILHNLGREARILERQIFEYWVRAQYYAGNPEEAKLYMLSTPFRERQILDELGYDKTAERYIRVQRECEEIFATYPDAAKYREPPLRDILGPKEDERMTALYALNYRVHSQMAHGTIAGVGGVWGEDGLQLDSRQKNPNLSLEAVTAYVLGFLELMNKHLRISASAQIETLKDKFHIAQTRLWASMDDAKEST